MVGDEVNKQVPVTFQDFQEIDERFMKVRIVLMHLGDNYNGSVFTKESVMDALPSLANTPILGFVEDNGNEDDFSDHRYGLERKDGELNIKYIGRAFGVIPQENNARFETITGTDGKEREYLVCDGLLWRKWEDSIDIMNRDHKKAQSMELSEKYEGYFNREGFFVFTKFKFFGACILGSDVLPAMNNASIERVFSIHENPLLTEVQEKVEEFKALYSMSHFTGNSGESGREGDTVEEKTQLLEKFSVTVEQLQEKGINFEEISVEDLEATLQAFEDAQQEGEDSPEKEESNEDADLDHSADGEVEAQANAEGEPENQQQETDSEFSAKELDYMYDVAVVENKLFNLQGSYSTLEQEIVSLREFKQLKEKEEHLIKANEVFARFDTLEADEISDLKEKVTDFNLEELEEKLFARLGKKMATFQQNKKQDTPIKIGVDFAKQENGGKEYDHLFEKFAK